MLNLSYEIKSLKHRIVEATALRKELMDSPSYEFDEGLQQGAAVQEARISILNEWLNFCYNLLGD